MFTTVNTTQQGVWARGIKNINYEETVCLTDVQLVYCGEKSLQA
jgi:hypothetical protein